MSHGTTVDLDLRVSHRLIQSRALPLSDYVSLSRAEWAYVHPIRRDIRSSDLPEFNATDDSHSRADLATPASPSSLVASTRAHGRSLSKPKPSGRGNLDQRNSGLPTQPPQPRAYPHPPHQDVSDMELRTATKENSYSSHTIRSCD